MKRIIFLLLITSFPFMLWTADGAIDVGDTLTGRWYTISTPTFELPETEMTSISGEFTATIQNGETIKASGEQYSATMEIPISPVANLVDPPPTPTPLPDCETGDVNKDSMIDILDAFTIARFYVGYEVENFTEARADVDGNGVIDIVDALLIAYYYVGLITIFPANT